MGLMKELNDLNNIYQKMYDEEYTVTAADKKGNTPAYQAYKAGKKNVKTGKPHYKAADHLKKEGYEEKKTKEVIGALDKEKPGKRKKTLSGDDKKKIAAKVVKDKGDTSKSDDRYAYEEVTPEIKKLIESGKFSEEEIKTILWNEGYQRNPEKGEKKERAAAKKDEAIPGQARRRMPPRGNPDREAFEKWYREQGL